MEKQTLLWIGETLFYIVMFFLLLILSRVFFKLRHKKADIDNELTTKDNVAFSILTTGYFLGILIIFVGVIQGDSFGYLKDALFILSYGFIGNILLIISSLINERIVFVKNFKFYKEIIKDENKGTGFIEAANFIGASLIIYGAITGHGPNLFEDLGEMGLFISGFISLISFWVLGQFVLLMFLSGYKKMSKYNILKEIEKDNNAVGIVYASIIISISYLYSQAIKGDIESWLLVGENILYYLGLGILLLPVSRWFVDKVILPKSDLTHEIVHQEVPNQGAALIEAFAYIGSAILISYCI